LVLGRQDDLARTFEQGVSQENANDHAIKQVGSSAVFDIDSVNFESSQLPFRSSDRVLLDTLSKW
jgi:hypothetical protein